MKAPTPDQLSPHPHQRERQEPAPVQNRQLSQFEEMENYVIIDLVGEGSFGKVRARTPWAGSRTHHGILRPGSPLTACATLQLARFRCTKGDANARGRLQP